MKKIRSFMLVISLLFLILGCTGKELTRDKAKQILTSKPYGLTYNLTMEYVEHNPPLSDTLIYHELRKNGYITTQQSDGIVYRISPTKKLEPFIRGKDETTYYVEVSKAVVRDVTGIAKLDETSVMVQYTIDIVPNELCQYVGNCDPKKLQANTEFTAYLNSVKKATFRLFDDGWRCEDKLINQN